LIENDEQLRRTVECLGLMYGSLAELYRRVYPANAKSFALMAQGPIDDIRRLQREIDEYVGLSLAEKLDAEYWDHVSEDGASLTSGHSTGRSTAAG